MSLKIYFSALSLRRTSAPPRKLFWVLGCWVVVCVKADYFPGAGGVGSLRLRPLFVPSIAVPSRPPRLFWIKSIYRPLAPLSLSLSLSLYPADDEAYALIHGSASSTSPSTSLRPKAVAVGGVRSKAPTFIFHPQHCGPSRPPRSLLWIKMIYRPLSPLFLSLSLYPRR